MAANLNTPQADDPINGGTGIVWNRLHSEREDICEVLIKEPSTANLWHRELLQSRLRKIDDALDRLMSGSYGNCCKCGRWIEDTKLDFDPAIAYCIECWQHLQTHHPTEQPTYTDSATRLEAVPNYALLEYLVGADPLLDGVALGTLAPFATIYIQTLNSHYRIFLLDPSTGRALIDGGSHFAEPVEVTVTGSSFGGSTFKKGWIGIGLRLEFRANGKFGSTSPVQSFRVEHHAVAEPASGVTEVIH